jgi:hypothetical protein
LTLAIGVPKITLNLAIGPQLKPITNVKVMFMKTLGIISRLLWEWRFKVIFGTPMARVEVIFRTPMSRVKVL